MTDTNNPTSAEWSARRFLADWLQISPVERDPGLIYNYDPVTSAYLMFVLLDEEALGGDRFLRANW